MSESSYKSMYKVFFDFDKEEQWLSRMSAEGYTLMKVNSCGKYTFLKTAPHRYNYRIDYRIFNKAHDFADYCTLFEDSGWKHISGSKNSGSQYFVQLAESASDSIFSDSASRAGRYKRYCSMWLSLLCTFFPAFVAIGLANPGSLTAFTNPKALYYTPGLWSMSGAHFWRAFLFETPFVVFRGFWWVIYLAVVLVYLVFFLKSYLGYRKNLKNQ